MSLQACALCSRSFAAMYRKIAEDRHPPSLRRSCTGWPPRKLMADADENDGCNDDDDDGDHGGDGNNEEVINWPGVARQCSWAPLGQQMMVMKCKVRM